MQFLGTDWLTKKEGLPVKYVQVIMEASYNLRISSLNICKLNIKLNISDFYHTTPSSSKQQSLCFNTRQLIQIHYFFFANTCIFYIENSRNFIKEFIFYAFLTISCYQMIIIWVCSRG